MPGIVGFRVRRDQCSEARLGLKIMQEITYASIVSLWRNRVSLSKFCITMVRDILVKKDHGILCFSFSDLRAFYIPIKVEGAGVDDSLIKIGMREQLTTVRFCRAA